MTAKEKRQIEAYEALRRTLFPDEQAPQPYQPRVYSVPREDSDR